VPLSLPPLRESLHSLEAFDAHHGSEPGTFPDGIDFVETAGTCRIGDPTHAITGTVYSTERAFRAAELLPPHQRLSDSAGQAQTPAYGGGWHQLNLPDRLAAISVT